MYDQFPTLSHLLYSLFKFGVLTVADIGMPEPVDTPAKIIPDADGKEKQQCYPSDRCKKVLLNDAEVQEPPHNVYEDQQDAQRRHGRENKTEQVYE